MRKFIAVSALAAALAVAGTVPAVASARVNWHQRTCNAASAYAAHPTRARLDTLITDSLHVAWHRPGSRYGLGSDVYGLGGDVMSGAAKYVAKDLRYIREDCA